MKRSAGGKRSDLNNRYFRSAWEANIARYLNWLQARGDILRWEYEPQEFWFEGIKRGTMTYKPDFKVWYDGERYEWWEVKGHMDSTSKTKLKRFARYFPEENRKLIIIGIKEYRAISKWKGLFSGWE